MTEEKNKKEEKTPETKEEKKPSSTENSKDNEGKEVDIPKKFKSLVEEIEKMSVLDLSELVKILEKKFGVSAQTPVAAVAVSSDSEQGTNQEEKSEFNVELTAAGENKIGVIKAIREFIQIGLKEAKDLVDAAPKVVKEKVSKEEAEKMKKALEEVGAKVNLK